MTPEELALRHPRLYHITLPSALPGILRHGLLPTSALLALFEVPEPQRRLLETRRRPAGVPLSHPERGFATLNDNVPLSEQALITCLDDGLAPTDWLQLLNARVFFWPDEVNLANHLGARLNAGRELLVLEVDTLELARRHFDRLELAAINTGSTIRKPARRGISTFVPAGRHSYDAWRRLRGGRDTIKEVTVLGGVSDITSCLLVHRVVAPRRG